MLLFLALVTPAVLHAQAPPLILGSPNEENGGHFGFSVSGVPDVSGDGRGDLVVSAPAETVNGEANVGRAYLYNGATGDLRATLISPNAEPDGYFGRNVAGIPDVDGDDRGDVLVGARVEDGGAVDAGRAYLFSGSTGALIRTFESPNPEEGGGFGVSVAGVADTDGDGRSEVLIGAFSEDGGEVNAGRAYLFSGATGALLRVFTSPNPEPDGSFGLMLAGVPNGDGPGHVFIGAMMESGGEDHSGRAYLFSAITGELLLTLTSPDPVEDGNFGRSVAGVIDVSGDGQGDLLVGAYQEAFAEAGRAYLFNGSTGELLHTLNSPDPESLGNFGTSVSGVPDTDGDGKSDLLIGAWESFMVNGSGRAYLFSGATGEVLRTINTADPAFNGFFGCSVSGVADADGDGLGDLLIGARSERFGSSYSGRAYLFSGSPTVASEPDPETPSLGAVITPNPAFGRATLTLSLPTSGSVRLSVHDVLGREVAVILDRPMAAGRHEVYFDGSSLPSGTYLIRIEAGRSMLTRQVTLAE
ncbi:MAG TPA: T9SS type A sorting domain-containing protein [Rubricoccaceae bacterium]|nr:T9SS type A sorting domain-containing protein [Rubricoccaceae bacterium]